MLCCCSTTHVKIPMGFFIETEQTTPKFVWSHKRLQATKETLRKKNKSHLLISHYVCYLVVSDSLWPQGQLSTRLLCPWNSPGKNTGVGCHYLLEGIFLTQGSNPGLLHCRQILYHLSYLGGPISHYIPKQYLLRQ